MSRWQRSSFGSILESPPLGCKLLKGKGQAFRPLVLAILGMVLSTAQAANEWITLTDWARGEGVCCKVRVCLGYPHAKLCSLERFHSHYHTFFIGKTNVYLVLSVVCAKKTTLLALIYLETSPKVFMLKIKTSSASKRNDMTHLDFSMVKA